MTLKDRLIIKGIKTQANAFTGPYGVQIGVSGDCNFRCRFCGFFSELNLPENYKPDFLHKISLGKFFMLLDAFKKLDVQQISFVGWGEPLLHTDIIAMIQAVKKADMRCMLTTNGSLLTEQKIDFFIESGLDILYLSLNAATSKTYSKVHHPKVSGRYSLEKVLNHLILFDQKKKRNNTANPHVGVRFVICSDNYKDVKELFRQGSDINVDSVTLQEWSWFESKEPIALSASQIEELLDDLKDLRNTGLDLPPSNIDFFIQRLSRMLSGKEESGDSLIMDYPCYVGWMYAMVMHNGDVLPCCNCNIVLGNINDSSFEEIWNGEQYRKFREKTVNMHKIPFLEKGCLCQITCGSYLHNKRMDEMIHAL